MSTKRKLKKQLKLIKKSNHKFGLVLKDGELRESKPGEQPLTPRQLWVMQLNIYKKLNTYR